jgi:hypothetical protein
VVSDADSSSISYSLNTTTNNNSSVSLAQTYTSHKEPASGNFSGLLFSIEAESVKWSINININVNANSSSSGAVGGSNTTFVYSLADVLSSSLGPDQPPVTIAKGVKRRSEWPTNNMTTYLVPLADASAVSVVVAQVQVFDVALVDGSFARINHSIGMGENGTYKLVLVFPPFERTLSYDPSLSLGILLGSRSGDGNGGGGDNTALIVAVAVAVPIAVIVVVVVVLAATLVMWLRRRSRHSIARGDSINFGPYDET